MAEQAGSSGSDPPEESGEEAEKTESFFSNSLDPHSVHWAIPSQAEERTRISESFEHERQVNS